MLETKVRVAMGPSRSTSRTSASTTQAIPIAAADDDDDDDEEDEDEDEEEEEDGDEDGENTLLKTHILARAGTRAGMTLRGHSEADIETLKVPPGKGDIRYNPNWLHIQQESRLRRTHAEFIVGKWIEDMESVDGLTVCDHYAGSTITDAIGFCGANYLMRHTRVSSVFQYARCRLNGREDQRKA
ncbi:hypothetical protein PMIN04_011932 [Paraphaeosphaeria minitans]